MKTTLDTAHTWFLEGSAQVPSGELRIRLVEGVKGAERMPVEMTAGVVKDFFPVTVESSSRVVDVVFESVYAFFTFNESYDSEKLALVADDGGILRKVSASSFRKHASATTLLFELSAAPLAEWLLWTEDQVFQVLATGDPVIVEVTDGPDLTIERTETWSAN